MQGDHWSPILRRNNLKQIRGDKMKLGLALAGGGAKGAAHIGILKALEENGITVDIIGGTSSRQYCGSTICYGL